MPSSSVSSAYPPGFVQLRGLDRSGGGEEEMDVPVHLFNIFFNVGDGAGDVPRVDEVVRILRGTLISPGSHCRKDRK